MNGDIGRLTRIIHSLSRHSRGVASHGLFGWVLLQVQTRVRWAGRVLGHRAWPHDSRYPLTFRPGSSDLDVMEQIFVEREYRCLDGLPEPGLILDCGANVGYSSAYFLTKYPKATVVAVEPDLQNYHMLRDNVRRFGSRVRTLNTGVWSRLTGLKIERGSYRDGREWAVQVRECLPGETPDTNAIDVGTLLAESGVDRISILKMDIERSELVVLSENFRGWIVKCDAILIELHDEECKRVFYEAIKGERFQVKDAGELTVCIRYPLP